MQQASIAGRMRALAATLTPAKRAILEAIAEDQEKKYAYVPESPTPSENDEVSKWLQAGFYHKRRFERISLHRIKRNTRRKSIGDLQIRVADLNSRLQTRNSFFTPRSSSYSALQDSQEPDEWRQSIGDLQLRVVDLSKPVKDKIFFIEEWGFDTLAFADALPENRPLLVMAWHLMLRKDRLQRLHINKATYLNFIDQLEQSYMYVPYHNSRHAADVMQGTSFLMSTDFYKENLSLIDRFCMLIAAAGHDVGHNGKTNQYHIDTSSDLAKLYNDNSVLESHHAATFFKLTSRADCNIWENFTSKERIYIRREIIETILGTDMTTHNDKQTKLAELAVKIELSGGRLSNEGMRVRGVPSEKSFLAQIAVHFIDIANVCKDYPVAKRWTDMLFEEFFAQGDLERESEYLTLTPMMDRYTSKVASGQVGFINYVVAPMARAMAKIVPEIGLMVQQMEKNLATYKNQASAESADAGKQ